MHTTDFLVIGGGVVGVNVARALKRKFPDGSVTLIEKESALGKHSSGRNSGVLHAGFYYSADSLKAKFTRQGNLATHAYVEERGLKINKAGKLVVAQNEAEDKVLDTLMERGQKNGVPLEMIDAKAAKEIEPRVRTFKRALWSPSTSSIDPREVMQAYRTDAEAEGITIRSGVAYRGRDGKTVRTSDGGIEAGYVVNAAGLYSDKIAKDYGFAEKYDILPFKGIYLLSDEPPGAIRTNIYPVPDLRNPFLGVHFTVDVEGRNMMGPTAIPAFWREQYGGLQNFNATEMMDIAMRMSGLFFLSGFDFRSLAFEEMRKYSRNHLINLHMWMAENVQPQRYRRWGTPGIRAQLLEVKTRKLEMDFKFEHDDRSLHILNAVSPGFTCAIPFAQYIVEHIH